VSITQGSKKPSLEVDGAEVRLRFAEPDDAPAIQNLWREILAEDSWFIETAEEHVTEPEAFQAELLRVLAQAQCQVWVAELRGCIVGVARLLGGQLARTRHVASLDLFLSEDVRGQGLGRRMMEVLIEHASIDRVLQRLELSVFTDNEAAIGLYSSLGFAHEGFRRRAVREADGRMRDILCMVRWV
jgi:RimJ/RimL family protein N-acetyltransferase